MSDAVAAASASSSDPRSLIVSRSISESCFCSVRYFLESQKSNTTCLLLFELVDTNSRLSFDMSQIHSANATDLGLTLAELSAAPSPLATLLDNEIDAPGAMQ